MGSLSVPAELIWFLLCSIDILSPVGSITTTTTINSYVNGVEMLTCGALGEQENVFKWRKRGSEIQLAETANISVTITSAFSGGDYECLVSENDMPNSITTVNVAPIISSSSNLTVVDEGANIFIFCQAEGFPAPSVSWYHNASMLLENARVSINNITMSDVIVKSGINISMAMINNSGNYTCDFRSPISTYELVSSTIVISVQEPEIPIFQLRIELGLIVTASILAGTAFIVTVVMTITAIFTKLSNIRAQKLAEEREVREGSARAVASSCFGLTSSRGTIRSPRSPTRSPTNQRTSIKPSDRMV